MSKIVYVRAGEKLQEVETFGEFDMNGNQGYVIEINGQTQLLNKSLTWDNTKEAQTKYLEDLKDSADKNIDLYDKYTQEDMEVIRLETPDETEEK